MRNHTGKIGIGILAALILLLSRNSGVHSSSQDKSTSVSSLSSLQTRPATKATNLHADRALPSEPVREPNGSGLVSELGRKSSLRAGFAKLAAEHAAVQEQFGKLMQTLPAHPESELVAMYGAQVLGRSATAEFHAFYAEMMSEISIESPRVFDVLMTAADKLRKLPFEHQVLLNLAADLDVAPREKARLMGPSLAQKFEVGPTNEISDGSACVTIALIQMRKANVSFQDISSFAQRGLELTNGDTRSTQEFWIRLKTYYPDATL